MLRSSRPGVLCENAVVKNFAKFLGKHLSYFKKHLRTTASGNSELILIIRMLLFTFFSLILMYKQNVIHQYICKQRRTINANKPYQINIWKRGKKKKKM